MFLPFLRNRYMRRLGETRPKWGNMALFADYTLSGDAYRWAGTTGLFSLTVKHWTNLIDRVRQWGWWDLNPRPPLYKNGTLTIWVTTPNLADCSTNDDSIGLDGTNGPVFADCLTSGDARGSGWTKLWTLWLIRWPPFSQCSRPSSWVSSAPMPHILGSLYGRKTPTHHSTN